MSYQLIKKLYSLKGIKLGLDRVEQTLKKLNNPQNSFKSIHIAGTNGKGSTASFLYNIFLNTNINVGLYTSPHILKFNERIKVSGEDISDKNIAKHYKKIGENNNLTFFEVTTIIAFLEFEEKNIDIAIIETGLGGRLDATNVLAPLISIITNISMEHKEYLGNTIEKITKEKAGIIKKKTPVISGIKKKQKQAIEVLKGVSETKKAQLFLFKKDFHIKDCKNGLEYRGIYNTLKNIKIGLKGDWQKENLSLSLCAIEILINKYAYDIKKDAILKGIKEIKIGGRLELIQKNPPIIIDVAHNFSAIKRVFLFLEKEYQQKKIIIIGLAKDKQYKTIIKLASKIFDHIILTEAKETRLFKADVLYKESLKHTKKAHFFPNMKQAIKQAEKLLNKKKNLLFVTGSFFIIEEFLKNYKKLIQS